MTAFLDSFHRITEWHPRAVVETPGGVLLHHSQHVLGVLAALNERPIIVGSAFDHALELRALIVHRGSARLYKISNDLPALALAIGRRRPLASKAGILNEYRYI